MKGGELSKKLLVALVNVLVLSALLLVTFRVMSLWTEQSASINLSWSYLPVFIIYCAAFLLVMSAVWRVLLTKVSGRQFSFMGAVEQTSLMVVAKYIPGKFWGVMVRAATCGRYNISPVDVVSASVIEQLLILYSSVSLGIILLVLYYSPMAAVALLSVLVCLGYVIFRFLCVVAIKLLGWLKARGWVRELNLDIKDIDFFQYISVVGWYVLSWLLNGVVLLVVLEALSVDLTATEFSLVLGAYILAVVAGFLALFAPGGIGVREGVWVLLVGALLPAGLAIQLALVVRLWNTMFDLVAGGVGAAIYFTFKAADENDINSA